MFVFFFSFFLLFFLHSFKSPINRDSMPYYRSSEMFTVESWWTGDYSQSGLELFSSPCCNLRHDDTAGLKLTITILISCGCLVISYPRHTQCSTVIYHVYQSLLALCHHWTMCLGCGPLSLVPFCVPSLFILNAYQMQNSYTNGCRECGIQSKIKASN